MDDRMRDAALNLISKAENAGLCPRCGAELLAQAVRNALSRVDNSTYICNDCGTVEAVLNMRGIELPPVNEWLEPKLHGIDERWCAYAVLNDGLDDIWVVALVQEHQPGYYETAIRSHVQSYAEARADWLNERHGLTRDRVLLIVGSSMAASE